MPKPERIIIVNVGYLSTNHWIVSAGRSCILVDLGWPGTTGMLRANLRRMDVPLAKIRYRLAIHYHTDHASLAQELKQTGVTLLVLEALGGIRRPQSPQSWAVQSDLSRWAVFLAFEGKRPVGDATMAYDTGLHMLAGCRDLAVLWDIRVCPGHRQWGTSRQLCRQAADWARAQGCTQLKIETQNVNVPACRFCLPQAVHEVMLTWYPDLSRA